MTKLLKALGAGAAAAVLITGMIAGSARIARAQSAVEKQGAFGGSGATAQPDKPPININGCWSGAMEDVYAGSGTGDVYFAQSGNKLLPSPSYYMMYFTWTDGSYAYGDGKGTAAAKTFHFKVTYKTEKGCSGTVSGKLISGDLVGVYHFTKVCAKNNGFGPHKGAFDFTYDATGSSCF